MTATANAANFSWWHAISRGSLCLAGLLCGMSVVAGAKTIHPLDPLDAGEITTAVAIIAQSGRIDERTRASLITLDEPAKQEVLQWKRGDPFERKALVVLRSNGQTIETVLNLKRKRIESWRHLPGVQPAIQSEEWRQALQLVKQDPRWQKAMRIRGYEDFNAIFCDSFSAGYFGDSKSDSKRLINMPCWDISDTRINIYAKPIEGVVAVVDLDAGKVVRVIDSGVVEVPTRTHEFDYDSKQLTSTHLSAPAMSPPKERRFSVDGRTITWQGWSFHLGFDQRFGAVLSQISMEDNGARRPILYQAHLSEVFVPYMEPSPAWSFRTYMDVGEYGLGILASGLRAGTDCPEHAHFIAATLATPAGTPLQRNNIMCVFEHDTAAPLWRHSEAINGAYAGRPATELIVRSIPSIAHYDYVIDWVFKLNGTIEIRVGATGIDAVKAVELKSMAEPGAKEQTEYGSLVAPNLVAIQHDHFFSFRLDFDIDGTTNRFVRERLKPVELKGNQRRSLWKLQRDAMTKEGPVSRDSGPPQIWRIENSKQRTPLGHHPSYQIQGDGATSLLSSDDWPQLRAAFSSANLWITKYRHGERFAAGAYPNQSSGGEGLPAYVSGEPVGNNDIVAWYTLGFHHVTRPEDWPVLTTLWRRVMLRPYAFFDQNPSLRRANSEAR